MHTQPSSLRHWRNSQPRMQAASNRRHAVKLTVRTITYTRSEAPQKHMHSRADRDPTTSAVRCSCSWQGLRFWHSRTEQGRAKRVLSSAVREGWEFTCSGRIMNEKPICPACHRWKAVSLVRAMILWICEKACYGYGCIRKREGRKTRLNKTKN
jgi:hypothetical protein